MKGTQGAGRFGLALAAALMFVSASQASQAAPAAAADEAPIVAEARAFMADYAMDLAAGKREAIAARYHASGAWLMGHGRKLLQDHAAIARNYATDWQPPSFFEWRDLSYEPVGPDAILVLGTFRWGLGEGKAPLTFSYTGLLVRQDGQLKIRLEDESTAPPKRE